MRCCKILCSRRERGISPKVCAASSAKTSRSTIRKRHSLNLRVLVRELLKAGDTDQQIEDFIVARYGEFVLLKPRFEAHTFLLWFATPRSSSPHS